MKTIDYYSIDHLQTKSGLAEGILPMAFLLHHYDRT
jgi:hypothetical protein